jgi:hypothetical protein
MTSKYIKNDLKKVFMFLSKATIWLLLLPLVSFSN